MGSGKARLSPAPPKSSRRDIALTINGSHCGYPFEADSPIGLIGAVLRFKETVLRLA